MTRDAAALPCLESSPVLTIPEPDDPRAVAWLAGLLEGEGTFALTVGYPDISASMCDRDVLERAARILGSSPPRPKDVLRNAARGWSPAFEISVSGSRAAEVMRELRPLMGERRGAEIDRALAGYHPIRLTDPPRTCVLDGCGQPHRSRGLCQRHYMSWSRDVKRGRTPRVTPLR